MGRIEVYRSKSPLRSERWRWRLVSRNGNVIATSGEGYTDKKMAITMATQVVDGVYKGATLHA
jgi:uncharacterized protein YegP (UPF0339 family)